jgi:hypothetical protein
MCQYDITRLLQTDITSEQHSVILTYTINRTAILLLLSNAGQIQKNILLTCKKKNGRNDVTSSFPVPIPATRVKKQQSDYTEKRDNACIAHPMRYLYC